MADSQPEPQNDPVRHGTPVSQRMQTPTTSVSPAEAVSPAANLLAGDGNKRSPRPRRQAQAHKTSFAPAAMDAGSAEKNKKAIYENHNPTKISYTFGEDAFSQ